MRVALIGCGRAGRNRVSVLRPADVLVACGDIVYASAAAVAREFGVEDCFVGTDRGALSRVRDLGVDCVIIATPHNHLAQTARIAVEQKAHVLVEKPGARRMKELDPVIAAADESGVAVHVGFNLRYHPALVAMKQQIEAAVIGEVLSIRAVYGHGGRVGYEQEWRFTPALSGGGEGLDQGVHLIDLARWMMGSLRFTGGAAKSLYWPGSVEDNAVFLLERPDGTGLVDLRVSWTEWRNQFRFEVFGTLGKLDMRGLFGSYGPAELTEYTFTPETMGRRPAARISMFEAKDVSYAREWEAFASAIESDDWGSVSNLSDARAALGIVEELYRASGREYSEGLPESSTVATGHRPQA